MTIGRVGIGVASGAAPTPSANSPGLVTQRGPLETDDITAGYAVNDYWQYNGMLWQCVRSTAGTAAWNNLYSGISPNIVDAVGASALCAYGVRLLLSGYAGKCLNVVRASDSTALDIGFLSNGWIDYPTLYSFIAGTTGAVAKWYDQSGNANDSVQATAANRFTITPQWVNGYPALNAFSGASNSGSSLWMPLPVGVAPTRNAFSVTSIGIPAADGGFTWDMSSNGTMFNYQTPSTGAEGVSYNSYYSPLSPGYAQFSGETCVSGLVSGAGGYTSYTDQYSLNGATFGAAAISAGGRIGGTNFSGSFFASALWQAFIVWSSALTATQLTTLQQQALLGFNIHPQLRDILVTAGDSITYSQSAGNESYQSQILPLLLRPMRIINQGVPSSTIVQNEGYISTRLGQQYISGANNICLYWGGTNDLYLTSGSTAWSVFTSLQTIVAQIHAAGFKCIVATALPRDWSAAPSGNTDTARLAYNSLIRNQWQTFAAGLADVGNDATMGPTAAYSNGTLYVNGVHPTSLGYSYLSPIFAAALNQFL